MLFDLGDYCEDIYMILSGVIDIVISDGSSNRQVLDSLGRGSVLGMSFILKHEQWVYQALNNTSMTAHVIKINIHHLTTLGHYHGDIDEEVQKRLRWIAIHGMS